MSARAAVLVALAVIGFSPFRASATEAGFACPNAPASAFVDNGAGQLVAARDSATGPLRILAIGSSSTFGVGASAPVHAYPAQLGLDLASQWGVTAEVRNAGVSGELAAAALSRLRPELAAARRPDLVIWQVGTNDAIGGVDPAAFRATLEAGLTAAHAAHVPIVLVDPQYYPAITNQARYRSFVDAIAEAGAKFHVPVFSRYRMMQGWGSSSQAALRASLSADGFHMDDAGYACFARALAGDIAREIGRIGRSAAKM